MNFRNMTDAELLDFCEEQFCQYDVCKALECDDLCKEDDCPLVQLFDRFKQKTEKGGEQE